MTPQIAWRSGVRAKILASDAQKLLEKIQSDFEKYSKAGDDRTLKFMLAVSIGNLENALVALTSSINESADFYQASKEVKLARASIVKALWNARQTNVPYLARLARVNLISKLVSRKLASVRSLYDEEIENFRKEIATSKHFS